MTKTLGQWTVALDGSGMPDRHSVGGKAWSIARMGALGLPVPPAFTITTSACLQYLADGQMPAGLSDELKLGIEWLNETSGRTFNGSTSPLLVSVRSGAPISMPGMMDTVLNLGITDLAEQALAQESGSKAFARDTHRRFWELFAGIVLKATTPELSADAEPGEWRRLIGNAVGLPVSDDPFEHLVDAVAAVFASWNSRRAKRYRKHNNIADELGTAVTVQAMVFGNLDDRSGTGVVFSRNPLNGTNEVYGEYLHRAQGEDVVSGKFTPESLTSMNRSVPDAYQSLLSAVRVLEDENADVQDIEFTVQRGDLYLLQTRAAKRAPEAAVKFATDMVREGRIDIDTALTRISADQIRSLLSPHLETGAAEQSHVLARGEAACQGVGIGVVVTSSDEAERRAASGEAVILARETTSPEDVHGMISAKAVITEQGGSTSHAAVVSRALGTPCIVGCGDGVVAQLEGQEVTVDGQSGRVFLGALAVDNPNESDDPDLAEISNWLTERVSLVVSHEAGDAGESDTEILDLSSIDGGEDPARIGELTAGHRTVTGGAIESDEGVTAAIDAGVTTIIAKHRLPVLIAAWNHQNTSPKEASTDE